MKSLSRIIIISSVFSSLAISCRKADTVNNRNFASADTLTQNIYTITETGAPVKGTILVAPFSLTVPDSGMVMIMDQDGKVLQKQLLPGATLDFNKWNSNGQTRYTYIVNNVNAYHIPIVGNFAGYVVITDSMLNEIKRVYLLPFNDVITSDGHALDVHDFIYFSDDHYIQEAYYDKHTNNIPGYLNPSPKNKIVAPIIQEVNNGAVIWQWDGSLDSSFYANSIYANDYADSVRPQDYMHLNAMIIDPRDNNLICSFRHQDQIIKVNRQTGNIMWRFGGRNSDFPLSADQVFLFQHDISLTDSNSTLMLFDNGDVNVRPQSRILEFKLDEVNKKVTGFKAFDIPEPFTNLMGSVQKFGDNYFIGGGTGNYVLEINSVTSQKIIEFKGKATTYRSYKFE